MNKSKIRLLLDDQLSVEEVYLEIQHEAKYAAIQNGDDKVLFQLDLLSHRSPHHIETFVEKVASLDSSAKLQSVDFSLYKGMMHGFIELRRPDYFYTPRVQLFFDATEKVFGNERYNSEQFDELVLAVWELSESVQFKNALRKWEYNFARSHLSAKRYIDALFEKYSRLLVIRIDLGFANFVRSPRLLAEETKEIFSKFLNARRNNKIFDGTVGYVWRREYGEIKGLHYHLLWFMDGAKVHKDEYRAMLFAEYWRQITNKRGVVFISNFIKSEFSKRGMLGIGMISHYDFGKRKNLDRILQYFFKRDQCLREKSTLKGRNYDRGEMPKNRNSIRGRPRKNTD